jgi:xanthine dehydrogenase accessory factor
MLDIVDAMRVSLAGKQKAVLATVLVVDGSVYQRDGARCFILEDGTITGIVSGGCVEKDLYEYSRAIWQTGLPKKIEYDFRKADDVWGLGLGCNGKMDVWLQPFDPVNHYEEAEAILATFERRHSTRNRYFCGTIIQTDNDAHLPPGKIVEFEEEYMSSLFELCEMNTMIIDAEVDDVHVQMFTEHIAPMPTLLIYGAGPDAKPLIEMAKFVEWRVVLADHRPDFANRAHFSAADEIVLLKREDYGVIPIDENTYVVVMTHNYELDKQALSVLLQEDIPYIGQLGPRKRIEQLLADIESTGILITEEQLEKLHSPIGLDIGANLPNEIAMSIMAEAMSRKNGRYGGPLRKISGSLHDPHEPHDPEQPSQSFEAHG